METPSYHFHDRHPLDKVNIPGEGVYPKCDSCGMQTNPFVVDNSHTTTDICWSKAVFFKYLGRLLAFDDNDMRAVRNNLKKARKSWRMLSRLLCAESIGPQVCGMFYKAVVQAILLFGSETWALTPSAMK
ncbi:hypothetical protein ACHAXR_007990 [Thalassiosira sp. AJA248-18]